MGFIIFCDNNYFALIDLPLRRSLPAGRRSSFCNSINNDRSTCKFIEFSGHGWVLFITWAALKTQ